MLCLNVVPADNADDKSDSVVRIGQDIVIQVLKVSGRNRRVLIGITAPDDVTIMREGVYKKLLRGKDG